MAWKDDYDLKEKLESYVLQNLQRKEILDFVNRDFSFYFLESPCSLRTLARMLQHFEIKYINYGTSLADIRAAVNEEISGVGKDLGYRAVHAKVRQKHKLKVTRDIVYATMTEQDPEGLEKRKVIKKRKKRDKVMVSSGVNSFLSIDGHDKMMGYQKSTFPIAIYGMMDQASRKILMLKCWVSNNDPRLIGSWYLKWLKDFRTLPSHVRVDCGTETGKLVSIHSYLRAKVQDLEDPSDCIVYGPSTSNQIERWWRDLHERLEKKLKIPLTELLTQGHYNPNESIDRDIMAFIMVPLVQREIDEFKDTVWNSHRIRQQRNTMLPCGIPNHIYDFPEQYGLTECGFHLELEDINQVEQYADVLPIDIDYLQKDFRQECENIVPEPSAIPIDHIKTAFLHLKESLAP